MLSGPTRLFDGGAQKRCFTDIADGVEALARIIDNDNDGITIIDDYAHHPQEIHATLTAACG